MCSFNPLVCKSDYVFCWWQWLLQYHYPSEFQDFMPELVWTHNANALYGIRNRLFSRVLLLRAADSIPWKWQARIDSPPRGKCPDEGEHQNPHEENVLWLP